MRGKEGWLCSYSIFAFTLQFNVLQAHRKRERQREKRQDGVREEEGERADGGIPKDNNLSHFGKVLEK